MFLRHRQINRDVVGRVSEPLDRNHPILTVLIAQIFDRIHRYVFHGVNGPVTGHSISVSLACAI